MTSTLAHIIRHPIKGHGREELGQVSLTAGECLPFDRHWAVAHEAAKLTGAWVPCANFARGAKALGLMAITSVLDEETRQITLRHPAIGSLTFQPDDPADLPRFLTWVAPLAPAERAQPAQIISVGRGMTDSDFPSVAILSLTTLRDLSGRMGRDLSIHRWRGNLWLEGVPLRAEESWPGRVIRIGGAVLRVEERITRCRATSADPDTGLAAGDTLAALQAAYGHQDFGVYATVLESGPVARGDEWMLQ
ncbi:MAG: MOSC domain-containing protein [Paracoccaceae bacterium]